MSESQPCTDTMCQEAIDTTADHLTLQENAGNTVVLSFACGPTIPTRERIDRVHWGDGTDEYYDVLQRCTDGRVDISHTYDDASVHIISGIYGASANDGRDVLVDQIKYIPSAQDFSSRERYVSPNGFSTLLPEGATVEEQPAQFTFPPKTHVEGAFGSLCISSRNGCGGIGMQGWARSNKVLTTSDGVEMDFNVWTRGKEVFMGLDSVLNPVPQPFSGDVQIRVETTVDQLAVAESILTSISFTE